MGNDEFVPEAAVDEPRSGVALLMVASPMTRAERESVQWRTCVWQGLQVERVPCSRAVVKCRRRAEEQGRPRLVWRLWGRPFGDEQEKVVGAVR